MKITIDVIKLRRSQKRIT